MFKHYVCLLVIWINFRIFYIPMYVIVEKY